MRTIFHILFAVVCFTARAQNGLELKGRVVDERKAAMPGATVFLGGTKYATTADTAGYFRLAGLKAADYKVIVKVVGYKPLVRSIVMRDKNQELTVQLEPDPKYLKAVTVKPDKSWLDNLETFKQQFLGESDNAGLCKLVNPGVLNFIYDRKTGDLTATADEMLIVTNKQLGYRLKYVLVQFTYNSDKGSVLFEGFPAFEELHGSADEEAQWKANRRQAYYGSIRHFMRSVYNQNCKAEGFVVYKIKNRTPMSSQAAGKIGVRIDYSPIVFDTLLTVVDEHHKQLGFNDALYVIFTRQKEPTGYADGGHSFAGAYTTRSVPQGQVSIVNRSGPVLVDENGAFLPTASLYFEGFMGWKKVGDLVPFEYDPTAD